MTTNSKHYETLNIQPWEIMEANFTTEEFIAYLKGNIIKYTLRSKGQDLSDAEKIKHYAEKLIEVQKGRPVLVAEKPEEVAEAPLVESYKFKVGDRVKIDSGWDSKDMKGTIIRTPVEESVQCRYCYIVELDEEENEGWEANIREHLVKSDRAWFVSEEDMELLIKKESKKSLEIGKWYDASTYTVEELKELLSVGTKVIVTATHDNDRNVKLEKEIVKEDKVEAVAERPLTKDTRIGLVDDCWFRRYFKIIK